MYLPQPLSNLGNGLNEESKMRSVIFFSLVLFSTFSWSAPEWKVVAESTSNCTEKFQVLAKEGEKFVYVTDGHSKTKIDSLDGSAFSQQNGLEVVFSNTNEKNLDERSKRFTFIQPSMMNSSLPKLTVAAHGLMNHCKMNLK
jgi:hypothetical protein